ncbi:filamentous hemagglutinin [Nostoc sp. CENA543]|uniref:beta strand repeat-containing protein n=1 Tax=Nostoc sp. CENA543 TaxID=1869241 RepID=UPI000CA0BA45|nr:S-layer family protein [Nostoc sp. CENA543]AUT00546.1 filamentous hemagglutinin [Nostoc sp. CENA543]
MKASSVGWNWINVILLGEILLWCSFAYAQVTVDSTLNTTFTQSGNDFTITDGNRIGNNLFHSFEQFSIPAKGSAFFNNALDVENIFSRVTGGNISHIDGLIKANGNANLFLLNPSGIIFGANAKLEIGGSFIATTANSIKFADGTEFSAVNPQQNPVLTINVPIGLQMGSNSASIIANGQGYTNNGYTISRLPQSTELQVKPGKTLALVGGDLQLHGLILTAPQGRIELTSTNGAGQVDLLPNAQGYTLGYSSGQTLGDIQLTQQSLLDVSGINAGDVNIQGKNIRFTDGSLVLGQNYGYLPGGDIRLRASEAIALIGTVSDGILGSGVRVDAFGTGASSNISVVTPQLILQQGAILNTITSGNAASGNIQIDAAKIEISGYSLTYPLGVTNITTSTYSFGSAGDIFMNSDSLLLTNGGSISSASFASGSGGKVTIRNQNTTVKGESPFGLYSAISLSTFATGNAQDLSLDTARLQILEGGTVGSSAFFMGNGGNVNINASEAIAISGSSPNNQSNINSSAVRLSPQLRQLFDLPDILTANAGNVSINTPNLILTDGGTVSVTSQGIGNGGTLNITSDRIQLKNQGSIQAQTESGNGGNINLQVGKLLFLRQDSKITATASGLGDGGNITINTPIITGWENSDIIANAVRGRGGNIQITSQGIIGLEYRPQITAENDITASSQFGVSGTVQVNTTGVDPNSGLVELPANVADPSQQIATGCTDTSGSSFIATGRGGIPQNPTQEVRSDRTWSDIRNISAFQKKPALQAQTSKYPELLVQATGWQRNPQGKIELITDKSSVNLQPSLTCAAVHKS